MRSLQTQNCSFIFSNFAYCPAVQLVCEKTSLDKLEKINCRALRFLYNDFTSTYDDLLRSGKHKSIAIVFLHAIAIEVYKSINGMSPDYVSEMFQRQIHQYNVRNNERLVQPHFSTIRHGYNSIRYLGTKIWNSLPNDVKDSQSLNVFKKRIKRVTDTGILTRII